MFEIWYLPKAVNCHFCGRFGRWRIKGETTGNEALDVCARCKEFSEAYAQKINHEEVVFRGTLKSEHAEEEEKKENPDMPKIVQEFLSIGFTEEQVLAIKQMTEFLYMGVWLQMIELIQKLATEASSQQAHRQSSSHI